MSEFNLEKYHRILEQMKILGFIVYSLGMNIGNILKNHSKNAAGFVIKASKIEIKKRNNFMINQSKKPYSEYPISIDKLSLEIGEHNIKLLLNNLNNRMY